MELIDTKIMTDKIVFRGSGILHLLYSGEDGQLYSCHIDVPFSQYAQLDAQYGEQAESDVLLALTNAELQMDADGNLRLNAALTGQYVVYERPVVEVVEDAYSLRRQLKPQMQPLQLPAVLDVSRQTVRAEQQIPSQWARLVDVVFYPDQADQVWQDDTLEIEMAGQFHLLCCDAEGELHSVTARCSVPQKLDAAQQTRVHTVVRPNGKANGSIGAGNVTVQADMSLEVRTIGQQGIPAITGMEMGEPVRPDPGRPSIILRRVGCGGLWELAKRCGSTVEAIRQANGLDGEPEINSLVLIPVC